MDTTAIMATPPSRWGGGSRELSGLSGGDAREEGWGFPPIWPLLSAFYERAGMVQNVPESASRGP